MYDGPNGNHCFSFFLCFNLNFFLVQQEENKKGVFYLSSRTLSNNSRCNVARLKTPKDCTDILRKSA